VVLSSLYETLTVEEDGSHDIDAKLCTELTLNWLLNVYDASRCRFDETVSPVFTDKT
jgi:hypothetical protein